MNASAVSNLNFDCTEQIRTLKSAITWIRQHGLLSPACIAILVEDKVLSLSEPDTSENERKKGMCH